jgi:hypothetical protein
MDVNDGVVNPVIERWISIRSHLCFIIRSKIGNINVPGLLVVLQHCIESPIECRSLLELSEVRQIAFDNETSYIIDDVLGDILGWFAARLRGLLRARFSRPAGDFLGRRRLSSSYFRAKTSRFRVSNRIRFRFLKFYAVYTARKRRFTNRNNKKALNIMDLDSIKNKPAPIITSVRTVDSYAHWPKSYTQARKSANSEQ